VDLLAKPLHLFHRQGRLTGIVRPLNFTAMRPLRSRFAAALTLTTAVLLAGCQNPERIRVIEPLPPPIIYAPTPTPIPAPPPPLPIVGQPQIRGAVIVIDPGHGGKDPGALPKYSGQISEKTIVLDIANRVARILSERGARVIMTRTGDTYPERQERADMAEHYRADLFVSIHANSAERRSASGAIVFIYDQASAQSQKAGMRMAAAFTRAGIECQGVLRDNFHVLREHSRPAMLIECGYMSNYGDAQKLNSAAYRARLAAVIADGAVSYFAP